MQKIVERRENNKKILKFVLRYLIFFVCFYILSGAGVFGAFYPFAVGMFFALIWCGEKPAILSVLYVLASVINEPNLETLSSVCFTILFILFACFIHTKLKKQIKINLFSVYMILSQTAFLFVEIYFFGNIIFSIVSVLFSALFMLALIKVFEASLTCGFVYKLNAYEIIGALILVCALAIGISNFNFFGFEFIKLFAVFLILLSAYVFNITTAMLLSAVIGLAPLISSADVSFLAPFVIWGLVTSALKLKNRIFPALGVVGADLLIGFFLNLYYSFSLISVLPTLLGAIIFVCLPNSVIEKLTAFFKMSNESLAMKNVVNRSRESLCKRLYNLSDIFAEMDYVFRAMIKGGLSKEQVKTFLISELKNKVCIDCAERHSCHRVCLEKSQTVFDGMITSALERGKSSLLDVPPYLTARCGRVSSLVSAVNSLCLQYKQYAGVVQNLDASRVLVAEQLNGMSRIMKNLASEVKQNISFDSNREKLIINELSYNNIVCAEAVLYQQNVDVVSATLVVRKTDSAKKKIEEIVSKICKNKMVVESVWPSKRAGWSVLNLQTAPNYDVIFGTASCAKDGAKISGDCYSIIRIDNDKFLLALCDGMGSGEKAEKASSLAIGLVENFYKAGFDNDIILTSVNKLLSLNKEEIFSALDICVVNTRAGIADFIKMGSPNSYIKQKESIKEIKGGALPLGIVGEMQPMIIKEVLTAGDMVFLFTDGVSDSFETDEVLEDYINNLTSLNPQDLAEQLLDKAIENSSGARDDMTVIVAKVFKLV